jgi:hypothetical protein
MPLRPKPKRFEIFQEKRENFSFKRSIEIYSFTFLIIRYGAFFKL